MFSRILTYCFAAYFFTSSAFLVCLAAIICFLTAPFDPLRRSLHRFGCWWGHHYVRMNPLWHVRFLGRENIPQGTACVLVANHQSYWDIMVLYGLCVPFKWVAKQSLSKMPFIGWNLALNQSVQLQRGDLRSIKKMLQECRDWLRKGASLMIFPEGTRSPNGEIAEFRDGPFKLAVENRVPVVPIVVNGTHKIFPKDSRIIDFVSDVTVKVLPPINPADFNFNVQLFRQSVHKSMKACLQDLRQHSAGIRQPAD